MGSLVGSRNRIHRALQKPAFCGTNSGGVGRIALEKRSCFAGLSETSLDSRLGMGGYVLLVFRIASTYQSTLVLLRSGVRRSAHSRLGHLASLWMSVSL